jgi:hypothetical protein
MMENTQQSKFSLTAVYSYYLLIYPIYFSTCNKKGVDYLLQNNPPLRQRRQRTNFNDVAIALLEKTFVANPYPDINEREALARQLNTTEDRIQVCVIFKRYCYLHSKTRVYTHTRIFT